jgi:superfamily II DNA helicase RecQ
VYYKIFNIPIPDSEGELERMNKFVSGVRVISSHKELVTTGGFSYWSFVIEYFHENGARNQGKNNKIDYKEVLSEEDFAVFSTLRELRKKIAEEDGVPVYTVFTNDQLAQIVTGKMSTLSQLKGIQGVGDRKIEKYGNIFMEHMKKINAGV